LDLVLCAVHVEVRWDGCWRASAVESRVTLTRRFWARPALVLGASGSASPWLAIAVGASPRSWLSAAKMSAAEGAGVGRVQAHAGGVSVAAQGGNGDQLAALAAQKALAAGA
jgi:hypothetical protein